MDSFIKYIKSEMSLEFNAIVSIILDVLTKNIFWKIIVAMVAYIVTDFIEPNQKMLTVVLIVFFFDFIT